MSNITGDGESFSSENNTGGEEVQQQQLNGSASEHPLVPVKKKRNLPGTPDPAAEVIVLSPMTLMVTNRFVCEICNKGFQRDQNLQLHRRGHNLPWKLRQRPAAAEVRKRVYVCPEPSCVHHNPSRALGDLTGIKKHFCRKHGEKKWKCDKCSKKYAVQSDWKAHSKTCGTREYKCDCGTIFLRRDSFITHRAFCDALADENNKSTTNNPLPPPPTPPHPDLMIPVTSGSSASISISDFKHPLTKSLSMSSPGPTALFSLTNTAAAVDLDGNNDTVMNKMVLMSGAHMSATALLQKAAQMGATASGGSGMMQQQMAGFDVRPYSYSEGPGRGYENQFFDGNMMNHEGSPMNENGIMFHQHQQQLHGRFMKSLEQESTSSSTSNNNVNGGLNLMHNTNNTSSSNARTVDFMGVGGARVASLPQPFQLQQNTNNTTTPHGDGGILYKSMWGDV